jgi:hypothetical protein
MDKMRIGYFVTIMKILITTIIIALSTSLAAAQNVSDKPTLPYYDWGACPFECCTYKEWTATRNLNTYKRRSKKSLVSFRVKKGQSVRGLTGVVITTKYGITKIIKPIQIGYTPDSKSPELSLQPGEVVYTLHYQGEAYDLFWYKGKAYSDQISLPKDAWGTPPNSQALQIISRPKYEWWAIIQDKDGNIGWTKETDAFAHIDACE